ncbi:DEA(D/H)-box RNA helicase family protein isoform X2 [Wolffia australiana]
MSSWSVLLRERWKTLSNLPARVASIRAMGGGPRTFPGGLNKWQFKRMHEKLARDKERKLLHQEKELYQARLRSQIRQSNALRSPPFSVPESPAPSDYPPISPSDHVKTLADRFTKEGAEDLWNEADGPLRDDPLPQNQPNWSPPPPLDLRKMLADRAWRPNSPSLMRRQYSTQSGKKLKNRWYNDSDSDSDADCRVSGSFFASGGMDEEDLGLMGERKKSRLSSAALMRHDRKKERRPPRAVDEEYCDLGEEVERIRDDLKKRRGEETTEEESILTPQRFEELNISPLTVKALSCAGFEQMTTVQAAALPSCLGGNDVLVKARTGTGKSLAFLIPAIEAALKRDEDSPNKRLPPIISLILCPNRELASQVAAEATVLLGRHNGVGVLSLIGGTRFKVDQQRLESDPCQIIVATPGRLLDHIENKSGFSLRLMGLKMLVLDEADHLLDLGFRKDIEKIVDCLPCKRQSLLFSATIPKEVRRISQVVLKREHTYIDTVGKNGQDTPPKVSQSYIIVPHNLLLHVAYQCLREHILQEADYKMNVREMHSRKPQLYRTRISNEFREGKRLILVTSDVSSRGINYPDVTLVLQMGVPCDREQYIHRLGRTGREGKNGRGIMLLAPFEEYFLDEIRDLPIENLQMPGLDPDAGEKMEESMKRVDPSIKEAAYHAWLGFYNSISETGRNKTTLVELANQFSSSMGLQCPPSLFRRTVLKMGLKDIPGIRVRKS